MSEPTTAAGRTLRQTLGYIVTADLATVPEMIDVDAAVLAIETEARAAALERMDAIVTAAFATEAANPSESAEDIILAAIDALREGER